MEKDLSIKKFVENYLESRAFTVAPSTLVSERSKCKNITKWLKNKHVGDVTHSELCLLLAKLHKKYSNKTLNGHLTILRAVFKTALLDGLIERDPTVGIENLALIKSEPNPFTKTEIAKMYDTECECENGKNMALLNVLTALRISEILALAWGDINYQKKELYVRRAVVLNVYKVPKTPNSERTVELNELAVKILRSQEVLTKHRRAKTVRVLQRDNKTWKKEAIQFVFINSKTRKPFLHAKQYEKSFFTSFLENAGIEHRGPGQLRHTFASQALTAGISKEWIAVQMGHNGTHMIDLHYGRWIKEDAPDNSHAVADHLQDVFGYDSPPPKLEKGHEIQPVIDLKEQHSAANDDDISALVAKLKKESGTPSRSGKNSDWRGTIMKSIHFFHRHKNFTSKGEDRAKLKSTVRHSLRMLTTDEASEKYVWEPRLERENFIYIDNDIRRLCDLSMDEKTAILDDIMPPTARDAEKNKKKKRQYRAKIKKAIASEREKGNFAVADFMQSVIDREQFYTTEQINIFSKMSMQRRSQRINMLRAYINVQNSLLDVPNKNNAYVQEGIFKVPHQWGISNKTISATEYIDATKKFLSMFFPNYLIKAIVVHDDERELNQETGIHAHYFLSAKNEKTGRFDLCQHHKNLVNCYIDNLGESVDVKEGTRKESQLHGVYFQKLVFGFFNDFLFRGKGYYAELAPDSERQSEARMKMNREASLPKALREFNHRTHMLQLTEEKLAAKNSEVKALNKISKEMQNEHSLLQQQIDSDEVIHSKLTDDYINQSINDLGLQLDIIEKERIAKTLEDSLEQKNLIIEQKKEELSQIGLKNELLINQMRAHREELEHVERIEDEKRSAVESLESRAGELKDKIKQQQDFLNDLDNKELILTAKIRQLEQYAVEMTEKVLGQISNFAVNLFAAYLSKEKKNAPALKRFLSVAIGHFFDVPDGIKEKAQNLCDELEIKADVKRDRENTYKKN